MTLLADSDEGGSEIERLRATVVNLTDCAPENARLRSAIREHRAQVQAGLERGGDPIEHGKIDERLWSVLP